MLIKKTALLLGFASLLFCTGCASPAGPRETSAVTGEGIDPADRAEIEETDVFSNECSITLGATVMIQGGGARAEGKDILITEGGVYEIAGELEDGAIRVESDSAVKLILNGAFVKGAQTAVSADGGRLIVESAEGTENLLSGDKAALSAEGALELGGFGSLSAEGAVVGKDGVTVSSGNFKISAKKNALSSDGTVTINGGALTLLPKKGKGIKAGSLSVAGGEVTVESEDDAIRVTGAARIGGGRLTLTSESGKGISADGDLTISGGTIDIAKSTEGLESKTALTVSGGYLSVTSSDDGFNAGGDGAPTIVLSGGAAFIDAEGDGLDSNGDIKISGGLFVIFGPTHDGDGALDCGEGHTIEVSGGDLLALGNAAMAQTPEKNYLFERIGAKAGNVVAVVDDAGETLISIPIPKDAETAVYANGGETRGLRFLVEEVDVSP
ncbi:MAG: carbohydrate-binding domain-containing protein [Bacteroides sp.]|nr:carbohydrate-binding domain-containing protein [Eubacterium sp.]MCM1419046.1 carbohydrate-binding domain-containing protein [Roseburia sp.]MCM1463611.1 carbohydrate-binding domain-containing protein [Bacteroides sp.]